jgi:hypothetical protein
MNTRSYRLTLLFFVLGACTGKTEKKAAPIVHRPKGVVIATVNKAPILASDLKAQMSEGQSKKEALRTLIRVELLVQEATRRGVDQSPKVLDVSRRSAAQLLIRRGFGETFGKDKVTDKYIAKAYKMNKGHFVHPEKYELVHLVAMVRRRQSKARHEKARDAILQARQIALAGKLTAKEFSDIPSVVPHKGIRFLAQAHTASQFSVAPAYAKAMMQLKAPGDVSSIVKTRNGYHLIYLKGRIPPKNVSLADARTEVLDKIFNDVRRVEFRKFASALEKKAGAAIDLTALTPAPPSNK